MDSVLHSDPALALVGAPPGPLWLHLALLAFCVGVLVRSFTQHH